VGRPWLHQLRSRLPGFVRRLHSYFGGVRLLTIVHHRLRLLAFPTRTSAARMLALADHVRTCQCLRRRRVWALAFPGTVPGPCFADSHSPRPLSRPSVLPSVTGTTSAPGMRVLSRLNGWPVRSPVNASPMPSWALRMTRGRCGSLLLHRDGRAPSTPCRSSRRTPVYPCHQTFSEPVGMSQRCL
jgi:hypothetical protein